MHGPSDARRVGGPGDRARAGNHRYCIRCLGGFAFRFYGNRLSCKAIDAERFEASMDLAKSAIARERAGGESGQIVDGKQADPARISWLERLVVESDHRMFLVRAEDIDWIQSSGDYVRLHVGTACHFLRQTMKELQAKLDPKRFLRVHRSAMVNLDRVKEFYLPPTGNMFVTLNTGVSLPLRRHTRFSLRRLLKNIS